MLGNEKKPGEQPLKTAQTNPEADSHVEVKVEQLTVHVFFDGTGNNKYNSQTFRENHSKAIKGSVSYANYYSNVALLSMAIKTKPKSVEAIYIEGSGTIRDEADEMLGMAFADGRSGRCPRYENALSQLRKTVGNIDKNKITLNVYGFSRGAAWARYFCHRIKKDSEWNAVNINFLGLFDTVSSDCLDHYNDVKELGLDVGKPEGISFIAHFTAENEYRNHFPSTRINGAVKDGIGFECSMPGAHSDIGGGYSEIEYEEKSLGLENIVGREQPHAIDYIDSKWFIKTGYYKPNQIIKKLPLQSIRDNLQAECYGKRKVYYQYQFIAGDIMREIASQKAGYQMVDKPSLFLNGINEMKKIKLLKEFHQITFNYVMANFKKKGSGYKPPLLEPELMKSLYNIFIHNSLTYGDIANGGTLLNKKNGDYNHPTRPQVTQGYR